MDARETVGKWFMEHDCDGLTCGECSCWLEDLMPCGEVSDDCLAAQSAEYGGADV